MVLADSLDLEALATLWEWMGGAEVDRWAKMGLSRCSCFRTASALLPQVVLEDFRIILGRDGISLDNFLKEIALNSKLVAVYATFVTKPDPKHAQTKVAPSFRVTSALLPQASAER